LEALEGGEDLAWVLVGALESVVECCADVACNGGGGGLVVWEAGAEFLDGGIDEAEAVGEGVVVVEVQFAKAGFEVRKGRRVQIVRCDARVAGREVLVDGGISSLAPGLG